MSDRPTYPELLKLFYKHSFPDQLGAIGSAVAQAIIYKANELYFPSEFKMSNVELSHLSGEDVSNIGRSRQNVLDICLIDGIPLFTYIGNKKRKAGTYIINYSLTSSWRQDNVNEASSGRQKEGVFDNDPNSTLPNETNVGGDGENFDWLMDQIQNVAPGSVLNETQKRRVIEFSEAPREKLEPILQRFAERGEKRERLISWIDGGLREFDRLYGGGNGGQPDRRAEWAKELKQMEAELAEEMKDPLPENEPWRVQQRERIANRRRVLKG
jgi:hypothetical protein